MFRNLAAVCHSTLFTWPTALGPADESQEPNQRWLGSNRPFGNSKENWQLIEETSPAILMTFACRFVGELFVDQRQLGTAVKRLKQKRDQRLPFRHSSPFPGENKLLLRNHFLINPSGIVLLAVQQAEI